MIPQRLITCREPVLMAKRIITVADFVRDVRSGATDIELMDKYDIDGLALEKTFEKMVKAKALGQAEIDARIPVIDEPPEFRVTRELPRCTVYFPLPVYETENVAVEGLVNDITEKGVQIVGIEAEPGEIKTLLIKPDDFDQIYPFVFDAVCRWSRADDMTGGCVAGFEIIEISTVGLIELRKLCHSLCL